MYISKILKEMGIPHICKNEQRVSSLGLVEYNDGKDVCTFVDNEYYLEKLSDNEVAVKVIHSNAGAINESDVNLAKAAKAIIIGFNVRPNATAKEVAEKQGVEIKLYSVIYQALEDVEAAMNGLLDPVYEEKVIGNVEVRQTFKVSNVGTIAGGYVKDGKVERNARCCNTRRQTCIIKEI